MSPAVWKRSGNALISPGRQPLPYPEQESGFVIGTTEPTWANSGCRIPQANLTTNTAQVVETTVPGQILSGLYLPNATIIVKHPNVRIVDCIINIGPYAGKPTKYGRNFAIVADSAFDTSNLVVEHVTVDPINAGMDGTADDAGVYGIQLGQGAVIRCAVRKVTDAVSQWGQTTLGPVHVLGNYLATRYWPNDPYAQGGGATHNDCFQIAAGAGHRMIGNACHAFDQDGTTYRTGNGTAIVISPYVGPIRDVECALNWCYWGGTQISAWPSYGEGGPGIEGVSFWGNRHFGTAAWAMLITPTSQTAARRMEVGKAGTGGFTDQYGTVAAGGSIKLNVTANTQGSGVPA